MKHMVWGILAVMVLTALIPMEGLDATSSQVEFYQDGQFVRIILEDDLPGVRWSGSIVGPDFEWSSPVVALGSEGKEVFIHPTEGELTDLKSGTYTVTLTPLNERDKSLYEDIVGQFTVGGDDNSIILVVSAICAIVALVILFLWIKSRETDKHLR